MPETINKQVLSYEIDRPALQRVRSSTRLLTKELDHIKDALKRQGRVVGQNEASLSKYGKTAAGLGRRLDDATDSLDDLRKAALDADRAIDRVNKTSQEAGTAGIGAFDREAAERARLYGDVESRTRAITGGIGYIGGAGLERQVNIGAELLASVEAVGLLKQELPKMTQNLIDSAGGLGRLSLVAGGFALAAGTAVSIYQTLNEQSKEAARATKVWLDALQQYYDIDPASKTTEQLEEEIQTRVKLGSQLSAQATTIYDEIRAREDSQNALEYVADAAGLFDDELEALRSEYGQITKAIQENAAVQQLLEADLDSGAIAANDFTVALEESRKAMEELSNSLIDIITDRARRDEEYNKRALDWTTEQIDKREEQIAIERATQNSVLENLKTQYDAGNLTEDAYKRATEAAYDHLYLLDEEAAALHQIAPLAKVREDEAAAIKASEQAIKDREKALDKAQAASEARTKALATFAEQSAKTEATRQRTITEEAEDNARKQIRDRAKHYRDLAKLDAGYFEKREDLLSSIADIAGDDSEKLDEARGFNRESKRLAEDHQKDLLHIQRDAENDIAKAARKLDAITIRDTQKQREQELDDAEKQYKTEQERREEDYRDRIRLLEDEKRERLQDARDRLRELEQSHANERTARIADYARTQAEAEADRNLKLQRQRAAWSREDAERRAALAAQLGTVQEGLANIQNTVTEKWQSIGAAFEKGMDLLKDRADQQFMQQLGQTVIAQGVSAINKAAGDIPRFNIPSFQNFGVMPHRGMARLEQGEIALGNRLSGFVHRAFSGGLSEQALAGAIATGIRGPQSVPISITVHGATDAQGTADAVREVVRQEVLQVLGG